MIVVAVTPRSKYKLCREFFKNIKLLRKRMKLSQAAAAHRSGLTRQHWSNMENGRHPPNLETVEQVAKALGVDPLDMLS